MPPADARPIVAITIGDPAGIGPEIVAAALARERLSDVCRPVVVGDVAVLRRAAAAMGVAAGWRAIGDPGDAAFDPASPDVIEAGEPGAAAVPWGEVRPEAGRAAAAYVRRAIELAAAGSVDAIATAPINKASLKAGGVPYLDHTAMFAALTGSPGAMTMFVLDGLRIFFATRHVSLAEAVAQITAERVLDALVGADAALRSFGIARPRIAVAALNPHAGEGGMFGDEELRAITPAIAAARERGIDATGPAPADAIFHFVRTRGNADAVLSLYHDQGHIAAKSIDFDRTIAITTGLPFVRASVDHGTAFDIAGTGRASHVSMAECIRVAARYATLRKVAAAGLD